MSKTQSNRTSAARVGLLNLQEPGVYELYLIQRKSMKVTDYRKRVEHSDTLTDSKDPEKVEKMVPPFNSSIGRVWPSIPLSMGLMFEEACLKKTVLNGI